MTFATNFKHDQKSRVDDRLERDRDAAANWRTVCKAVDARDHRTCRACGKRTNPDDTGLLRGHRHHLIYRSAGGQDVAENLVTLCAGCHSDEHHNKLQIQGGDASEPLSFWKRDDDGAWFQWRREIAVGRFEKD